MRTEQGNKQAQRRNVLRSLSFWLALIGVASLTVAIFGVYVALREPEPAVTFETISETNVLDLRRPLQDLNIAFRGQDVQEQNLSLRIVTVNVVNSGEVDILSGHYDLEDDWGMTFEGGEVIEARLVDSDSDYLRSKIVPQIVDADTVTFPKVIFEKGASFAVEVLLLHPKEERPSISSVGKIAGINEITILTRPLAQREVSFVSEIFYGSVRIQGVRTIVYFVGFIIVLVAIIFAIVTISNFFEKLGASRRRNQVSQTQTFRQLDQDETSKLLVALYESNGIDGLKVLHDVIGQPGSIRWTSPPARWDIQGHHMIGDLIHVRRVLDLDLRSKGSPSALTSMADTGILSRGEDGGAVIDKGFCESVDKLLAELDKQKAK